MSNTMKTVLIVAGTAAATGVICNVLTDGAVAESISDKWNALTNKPNAGGAGDAE